jgi:hypothetical protein
MEKHINSPKNTPDNNNITRKEAISKVGRYAAFTAASMMLLMSPVNSSAGTNSTIATQRAIQKPKRHQ